MSARDSAALRLDGTTSEVEDIEVRLLLEGIHLCYGYDFREYSPGPLRRGIQSAMARERVVTVSAYQDRVLHDAACMQRFPDRDHYEPVRDGVSLFRKIRW